MDNSEEYMKMEFEEKVFRRDRPCSRRTGILVLVGSVFMIIFMIMIFVIFAHQERKFSMLERWMNTHSSNMTSVKSQPLISGSDLEKKVTELQNSVSRLSSYLEMNISRALNSEITERQQNISNTEMKSLLISLSSSLSALTSKLNAAVGNQEQKLAETKRLLDSLTSSVASLQSDQQSKQHDFERQQNISNTEMKSLLISLSSSLSALTSKLNDAVGNQEQKLAETARLLDSLTSSVASLQSDQQIKQRDFDERIMNALNELKTKMSSRTTDTSEPSCKSGWVPSLNNCYLFSKNTLNWSEAVDYCKGQGAQLLKLEKDDDREWITLTKFTKGTPYWIGLTDRTTGQWRWADDTPYVMNKDHWHPGQPDDWKEHGLGEEGEDCAYITQYGKLNDIHCSEKMKYICKV